MAHISRPFQIALLAVVLLAGVWLFALRSTPSTSSSNSNTPPSASSAPAPSSSSSAPAQGSTPIYHGAAPGVEGLTRALAKAHEAVATSQQNEQQLEQKSAQASSATAGGAAAAAASGASASSTAAAPITHSAAKPSVATASKPAPVVTVTKTTVTKTTITRHPAVKAAPKQASGALPQQKLVESRLSAGNIVLLLFWNHKGADDVAVQRAVQSVAHSQRKVVVQEAQPSEVAAFGSITRGVQVYGTPTLLIVGKNGHTIVITGLTDPYSIGQAVSEARSS